MNLRYVVITSVNRDDLCDGGSAHFAATVRAVRAVLPEARIEVLTPDFCGDRSAVERVLDAEPDVFNHNIETVPRLYHSVRPQASYRQSLEVIAWARAHCSEALTKSGLMVGLGEQPEEVNELLRDLRAAGCDVVTIGQYLQAERRLRRVHAYVRPEQYDAWKVFGLALGFKHVFAGPFIRSSYMAEMVNDQATTCGSGK